jgi:hypothetical protein
MSESMPTYEQLVHLRRSRGGGLGRVLERMTPGEVVLASELTAVSPASLNTVIGRAARAVGLRGHFSIRRVGDAAYVIRLRPEDVRE